MPRRQDVDAELRRRLAAWTLYLKHKHEIPSLRRMAKKMGMSGPTITNAVNHQSGIGLDYLVALHRSFHVSADVLLDDDPPPIPIKD
jgi:transcriptional regulator with XRE-family HTH domain